MWYPVSGYDTSALFLLFFRVRLCIDALWSPAEKGLTSWLSFVMLNCVFVTFPCGILGQVWYLIVSIFVAFLILNMFRGTNLF